MNGGIRLGCAAVLLLAGCAGSEGKLNIRAIPPFPSASVKPVPARIAEARGHLALNNVALALEGFRKAQRDDPASIDALLGIATCYDRMGRFDVSRRYFEMALAFAPTDAGILNALAKSLGNQGRHAEAADVRSELAVRSTPAAPALAAKTKLPTATVAGSSSSVTVALPPAASTHVTVALPSAAAAPAAVALPPTGLVVGSSSATSVRAGKAIAITANRPVKSGTAQALISDGRPARSGPRLERLSLGEVALVTTAPSRWRGEVVRRTSASTTVRFVPLRTAMRDVSVRLLNAARFHALAARTRVALNSKGWNRVSIGDAGRVRQKSLVLYSSATAESARRLAAELGIGLARDARPGPLTVLLGRDARPTGRSRG